MRSDDDHYVRANTRPWQQSRGRGVLPLFEGPGERVSLQRLDPGETPSGADAGGAELLVLAGGLRFDGKACPGGSWIRVPTGAHPDLVAGAEGATVYLKTGHLVAPLGVAG